MTKQELLGMFLISLAMLIYFITATPIMNDDGFHYEGFAESLAEGKLDFKSFYGFQGLSFFAVPIFWLTGSDISIIIASMIFSLLSVLLAYLVGRDFYNSKTAGYYFLILFLLTPYPYTTMMRGFQEAALLFFILLIIYGAVNKKLWSPIAWAVGGIVKPFALTLFPLFIRDFLPVDKRQSSPGVGDAPLRELAKSFIHMGAVF
jgi:4-amino-4-deoxy-L-arabinose transferase-like glycosyltransferase